ncbi:Alpha/Beta hydrolase protein [Multifurca ochricompacta]|uniref:Carboxylic ester hydrolase n=1 Tax=Multifurca ochricompacta TaxID=376703 RepID=A0AAD4M8Z4_9AGAM|nr:Alpha/Beta hydrolase protein [Multifurca ochricompacta]
MGVHVPPAYQPVVRHSTLKTTFTGIQHTLSTAETPIHQYRGVKYATIPARFRQSKLFTSYRSSTDATRYGPICPQPKGKTIEEQLFAFSGAESSAQNFKQIESECLNLNITCPGGLTRESRLPVMVWVHGNNDRGSGSHWLYDGGCLVQSSIRLGKPVILVTINYRLGLLGCAAGPKLFEDNKLAGEEGVGNYGLRDQRRALEWVHHFIADFGGDGSNITLFGASTGASDIISHLNSSSNASYPLFSRAIVQSPVIDHNLPSVSLAGVHLSKVMSALRTSTIQDLRKVPVDKLVNFTSGPRAVDDGYFFKKNGPAESRSTKDVPQNHLHVPKKLTAQCIIEQHIADTHGTHPSRIGAKVLQILHHDTLALVPSSPGPAATQQPVIIGDCGYESFGCASAVSAWTPAAVVRRVGAICQSVKKSNVLLRTYDISAHTPDDEFPERLLELINDARFAWPTHLTAEMFRSSRSFKDSSSVWRYVFDQEAPGSGVPHQATDLLYLFDTARPAFDAQSLIASPDPDTFFPDRFDVDDDDDDVPFDNSAFDDDASSDGEPTPSVEQYQYTAVRDALQARWFAFAYGQAPWSRDKVFVFGPEGEAGERGSNIFESRRRTTAWRVALEPLGRALAQKVGLELSNGPSGGAQFMQPQQMLP